jgi:hypothetical protein
MNATNVRWKTGRHSDKISLEKGKCEWRDPVLLFSCFWGLECSPWLAPLLLLNAYHCSYSHKWSSWTLSMDHSPPAPWTHSKPFYPEKQAPIRMPKDPLNSTDGEWNSRPVSIHDPFLKYPASSSSLSSPCNLQLIQFLCQDFTSEWTCPSLTLNSGSSPIHSNPALHHCLLEDFSKMYVHIIPVANTEGRPQELAVMFTVPHAPFIMLTHNLNFYNCYFHCYGEAWTEISTHI